MPLVLSGSQSTGRWRPDLRRTDAGGFLPHGLVGKEIAALGQFSSLEYALGGSWRLALAWPAVASSDGAPADLVVFDADPRVDLAVLSVPRHVILRGAASVEPSSVSVGGVIGPRTRRRDCRSRSRPTTAQRQPRL